MREFRCKNEKAGKKRMEKNNAKNDFFYYYFIFCKLKIIDSFGIIKSNFTKYSELFFKYISTRV